MKHVSKTYEYLIQYLRGMQGSIRIPLSYAVRESNDLHPKPSVDDPVTAYTDHNEEMVKRAPIIAAGNPLVTEEDAPFNESFIADRGKV